MPQWTFVLSDAAGVNLAELATATGRTLTFQRNGLPEASLTISHEDDAAAQFFTALGVGIPRLKAFRDGILRFHGQLAPFSEELEEDAQLNLVFRGPFSRLLGDGQYPGRFTAASVTFAATDAGAIAKSLIDTTQLGTGSIGIDTSLAVPATKLRDRTYLYANVGEEIVRLTNVQDGFDFEIVPVDGANLGQFQVFASQGSDRTGSIRFEYGPVTRGNVRSVQRQTLPPINVTRVIGANGLVSAPSSDAGSIAKYGEWWAQEQRTDISEQATLDDRARAALRPNPLKLVSFSPEPALAPSPWTDYWLGDRVSFYGLRGAFSESSTMRVNRITVVVDDEGNEAFEIEDPTMDGGTISVELEAEIV